MCTQPTCYFGYFGYVWSLPSKTIMTTCRIFDVPLHAKNKTPSLASLFSKDIANLLLSVL